jgi:hypothetical protein
MVMNIPTYCWSERILRTRASTIINCFSLVRYLARDTNSICKDRERNWRKRDYFARVLKALRAVFRMIHIDMNDK